MADDQEFKILITGNADSYVDAAKKSSDSTQELKEDTSSLGEKTEDTGKKIEQQGDHAMSSAGKHAGLKRLMGELNRISPGLGEAMHLLSHAYTEAGEAAEGGAVGVTEFNVALEEVLMTMGPLIIAMLAIEAAFTYWDMYKEKVKAAAEAQEEATKRMLDSIHEVMKAQKELDEAMHPKKHNTAEKDEADLKQKQEDLERTYNRQKELSKAEEQKQLGLARSPAEKEDIKRRFEEYDTQLEDWRAKQKAAIEEAMVGTMNKQLADLKAANEKLIGKSKAEFQYGKETGDFSRYNVTKDQMQKGADEAKAIREKLDDLTGQQKSDATNAAYNSETHQEVNAAKNATEKFTAGQTIADTASRGGQVSEEQKQFLIVLEQATTGQRLTFQQAVALMEAQSKSTDFAATLISNAQSRIDAVNRRLDQLAKWSRNANMNHL